MISRAVCNVSKQQEMAVESEWQQPVVVWKANYMAKGHSQCKS